MVTVVKRKAVLRKPPRSQQDHVAAPYSFLSCFVGETQSTKMSPAQTDLLGNSCFCLKKNCSGIVHVVEMERTRTLSCTDIPLYSLETRRLVKCNKCFYVSTLQAHRLNSRGNAKLAAAQANEKETETETATIEDSQEVTENCSQAATEQDQQRDANGAYQDECSGIVAKNITYHGKPKNTVTNKSLDEEEQTSNVSQATSNNDDRLKMIMEGIRAKGREADKEADGEHQDTVTDDEEKPLYVEKEEFYPEEKKPPQWLLFVNDEDHVDTDDICSWHSGQRASQALTCRAPGDDGQSLTSSKKRDPNSGDPPQKLEKDLVLRSAPSTQSDLIHYIQRVSQDSSKKAPHDPPRHKADDEPLEGSSWCDPDKESPKATATTKDNQRRSSDPPMNDPPSTPVKKPADPKGTRLREPRGRKKSAPSKTSKLTNPARLQKRLQQHQQQKEGKQQEEEEGKRQQEKFNHVRSPEKEPIEESEQREAPDSPDLEAWRRNHEYKGDLSALSDD